MFRKGVMLKERRASIFVPILMLLICGCEVAQESVFLNTEPINSDTKASSTPTQTELVEALQNFAEVNDFQCRQNVKRWDEWTCAGPHAMRITFEPDRGKNRFVAEFTLVIRSDEYARDYRRFVDHFVEDMKSRFGDFVVHEP